MNQKIGPLIDGKKWTMVSMKSIVDVVGAARSTVLFVLKGKQKEGHISKENSFN